MANWDKLVTLPFPCNLASAPTSPLRQCRKATTNLQAPVPVTASPSSCPMGGRHDGRLGLYPTGLEGALGVGRGGREVTACLSHPL